MQELIAATCTFLEKEPETRYGELMHIMRYRDPEHILGFFSIILPACSAEENIVASEHLGEDVFQNASRAPNQLFSMLFNDVLIEAGPEVLTSLCIAALQGASPQVRRNMLSHIENGRIGVTGPISLEIMLMLGDPKEDIRERAADNLSAFMSGKFSSEVSKEQLFLNTFYLGDVNAARRLAERIETQVEATAFVYLCLTQSSFGPAKAQNQELPKEILAAFYSAHNTSKIDFQEAVTAGLCTYCSKRKCFLGLKPHEENVLRRALKYFIKSAKEMATPFSEAQKPMGKRPSKTPKRVSQPPHKHMHKKIR